jgi:hypothetical protein
LVGCRTYRHAAWDEQLGAAGPRSLEARPHAGDLYVFRGKREVSDIVHLPIRSREPEGTVVAGRRP